MGFVSKLASSVAGRLKRFGSPKGRLISIVLLLREPCSISEAEFRILFSTALGVELGNTPSDSNIFVQFKPGLFGVQTRGQRFGMVVMSGRYTKEPLRNLKGLDVRFQQVLQEYQGWIGVDLVGPTAGTRLDHAYSTMGKLLAEIIEADPANVLACYSTDTGTMVYMYPALAENLRGKEPLAALGIPNPPIIKVRSGDPEIRAAADEARNRWPEFAGAFATRSQGDIFSVKVGISSGLHREYIWITPTSITGNQIEGILANEPSKLRGLKINDPVTASIDDLNDWLYRTPAGTFGGFTVKVLLQRKKK